MEMKELLRISESSDSEGYAEDLYDDDDDNLCSGSIPKLQFRSDVSEGKWIDDLHMAEVVTRKGRMWNSTGIVRNGKLYYSIEETLYLAEIGAFRVLNDDGSPLPLTDIYTKLLEQRNGCSWESFEAYKHLKCLGYVIRRHNVEWSIKGVTLMSSAEGIPDVSSSSIAKMLSSMQINDVRPTFDVYPPNSKFKKSSPGSPAFVLCLARGLPPSKREVEELEKQCGGCPLKFCNVDHGRVSIFSIDRVELPVLP